MKLFKIYEKSGPQNRCAESSGGPLNLAEKHYGGRSSRRPGYDESAQKDDFMATSTNLSLKYSTFLQRIQENCVLNLNLSAPYVVFGEKQALDAARLRNFRTVERKAFTIHDTNTFLQEYKMMKKSTWRKLFTRNKSKTRDPNNVVCDLCVGMPVTDIGVLCDHHRNAPEAPKSQGILKVFRKTSRDDSKHSEGSKKKFGKRESKEPPASIPENVTSITPVGLESVVGPASETHDCAESNVEKPMNPEQMVAQTLPPSPVENPLPIQPDLNLDKISEGAESVTEKPMTNPEKLDSAATNEEFMTEEVDSPSLSENSHTENTVPIVIEPPEENLGSELQREDSQLKRKISFTSPLPTKIFEIPSKEEQREAEKIAAAEDGLEEPERYVFRSRNGPKRKKNPFNPAVVTANQTWFGTARPGNSEDSDEQEDDYDDDDNDEEEEEDGEREENDGEEGEEQERQGKGEEEEGKKETLETEEQEAQEYTEETREDTHEREQDASSETTTLPVDDSSRQSAVMNPNLSEPTPLSSLLPNVFLNTPKKLDFPIVKSLPDSPLDLGIKQKVDSLPMSIPPDPPLGSGNTPKIDSLPTDESLGQLHSIEATEPGGETHKGGSESSSPCSQVKDEQDQNTDEGFDEEQQGNNEEDSTKPWEEHNESMTLTTMMDLTERTTEPTISYLQQIKHADRIAHQPAADQPASDNPKDQSLPSAVVTSHPLPQSEQQTPQADHSSARMVFGTIAADFTNQPLFFSPNFGAQRMGPISDRVGRENIPGEEPQFPHYSIYDVMRNYIKTVEPSEEDVARVTEVTDSEPTDGRNPQKQQHQQPDDVTSEQSPPSLEAEEEFEQNSESRKASEEQKELKKE